MPCLHSNSSLVLILYYGCESSKRTKESYQIRACTGFRVSATITSVFFFSTFSIVCLIFFLAILQKDSAPEISPETKGGSPATRESVFFYQQSNHL